MRSRAESDARLRSLESAMRVGGLDDAQIDNYFSDMMTKEEMLPYIEGAEQQGYYRCKKEMLPYIEGAEQQGYDRCKKEMIPYIEGAEQQGYDRCRKEMLPYIEGAEQQGFNRGHEQGKAEGKAEGIAEGKIQVARGLLAMGFEPDKIAKATGMSIDEIEKVNK